jgi:hypothetical protein
MAVQNLAGGVSSVSADRTNWPLACQRFTGFNRLDGPWIGLSVER